MRVNFRVRRAMFTLPHFSQDKGLSVKQATLVVLLFGIGAAVGGLIGGVCGQRVYNKDVRYLPVFIGLCQIAAVFPMTYLINMNLSTAPEPIVGSAAEAAAASIPPSLMIKLYFIAILSGACLTRCAARLVPLTD